MKCIPKKSDKINSKIEGQVLDERGNIKAELFGSWLDEISVKYTNSGQIERLWKEYPLVDNAHLQFYFSKLSVILNYKNKEMEGYVAPTDSRWRKDLRLYEEGLVEESDEAKVVIENK